MRAWQVAVHEPSASRGKKAIPTESLQAGGRGRLADPTFTTTQQGEYVGAETNGGGGRTQSARAHGTFVEI